MQLHYGAQRLTQIDVMTQGNVPTCHYLLIFMSNFADKTTQCNNIFQNLLTNFCSIRKESSWLLEPSLSEIIPLSPKSIDTF